ncbi:hypothetical protein IID27_03055 [Patescibacteria group bacterium]|nr:hypothetical protein [Patescibacteria group bacterium]
MDQVYQTYKEVLWYRKSPLNSLFVFVGAFMFPPLLWLVIYNLITGDIYINKTKEDGTLKTWSIANKVVAWVFLFIQIALFLLFFL